MSVGAGPNPGGQEDTLVLSGSLKSMCLSDLLQWIALGRKTGKLFLERDSLNNFLYFKEGRIISSSSNNPRESFGHFLVTLRQITEAQLFKALVMQHKRKKPLGEILVEDGLLTEEIILKVLDVKTRETIFDMFSWTEGKFFFYEEDAPEKLKIMLALDVSALIFEGIKRIDDWTRIREQIPCNSSTFSVRSEGTGLSESEEQVLQIARKGRTLGQIALDLNISEYEAGQIISQLMESKHITLDSTGEDRKPEETVRVIRKLIKRGDAEFKEGRFDASFRTFQEVLGLDSLNQYAKIYILKIRNRANNPHTSDSLQKRKIPILRMDTQSEEVVFTPQEIQVMAQINGERDVETLIKASPLSEEDTLNVLKRFLTCNIISFR